MVDDGQGEAVFADEVGENSASGFSSANTIPQHLGEII